MTGRSEWLPPDEPVLPPQPRMEVPADIALALAKCEEAWNAGRLDALVEAYILSAGNGYPLPQWAYEPVLARLNVAYAKGKRGRAARHTATGDEMNAMHLARWRAAEMFLRLNDLSSGGKPRSAYEQASEQLKDTPAFAEPRQIRESHTLVEKAIKAGTAARFGLLEK